MAAVAAVDEETAEEAIDLIRVEYEPLSPVVEVREALQPGSPLVHEEKESNVASSSRIARGDVERGFDESEIVVEEEFRTQFVHALYMEPQITVALGRCFGPPPPLPAGSDSLYDQGHDCPNPQDPTP